MEKKLKFAEFASLIGVTAKTVYKMAQREEIVTVTERVNNRLTQLVICTEADIEKFKVAYRKVTDNIGNYEDILTYNENTNYSNEYSQSNIAREFMNEMFDKITEMNKQYNLQINTLNEQLTNSKAQLLFLEDKASREGLYINEIEGLKTENKQLKTDKENLQCSTLNIQRRYITVIVVLLLLLTISLTFIFSTLSKNEESEPTSNNAQVQTQAK